MESNARAQQIELIKAERVQKPEASPEMKTVTRYRLALVREEDTPYGDRTLSRPADVARFLSLQLDDRPQEVMCAVYLDTRNHVIAWQIAYLGTINRAAVEPRAIFQMALLTNACGVVIAHNHPSGDPTPSREDIAFSKRMSEAGDVIGVRLVDSLIIATNGRYISLRERGAF